MVAEGGNEVALGELERAVRLAVAKIESLKETNKKLREEVIELKRLLAISEKAGARLRDELQQQGQVGELEWRKRERMVKEKLKLLTAKIAAFERIHFGQGQPLT